MATKMTREEAIKIVQSATVWTDEERDALAMLIPELAESEDERIRKHLIEIVETYWGKTNEPGKAADLAWLEKQKEQKPGEIPPYVTGIKGEPDPAGVWKPSEEQMGALLAVINDPNNIGSQTCQLALTDLYEQLKKL